MLGCEVQRVTRTADGRFEVDVTQGGTNKMLHADGVVCATTASVIPAILGRMLSPEQRDFFGSIKYSATAVLARTYTHEQIRGDKGIAFPRREGSELSAVTVAPEPGGSGILANVKVFASGVFAKEIGAASDHAITERLDRGLEPIRDHLFVGRSTPLVTHVQRWPEALPFFDVGHFSRLRAFEQGQVEDRSQALTFAGDYLGGPFMEGAFTSGKNAAERLMRRLAG